MSKAHQAALTLHAMRPIDRAWMLDQLPAPQRKELTALLDELQSLGIPADPQIALDATRVPTCIPQSSATAVQREEAPINDLDFLGKSSAESLYIVLADEPCELVAMLLSLEDFAWRPTLISLLSPAKRAALQNAKARALSPTLSTAMVAAIVDRLRGIETPTVISPRLSWIAWQWRRLWT